MKRTPLQRKTPLKSGAPRRKRSAEDFERKRRDRKAEVERAARKAL